MPQGAAAHGIPTVVQHRRYRSLLEAKWAAMFERLGWQYEYEPFELEGWIPDFALRGYQGLILVEVKPVYSFEDPLAEATANAIAAADGEHELLLLGCGTGWVDFAFDSPVLGWLREMSWGGGNWDTALYCQKTPERVESGPTDGKASIGFCAFSGSYACRMTGRYTGGHIESPSTEIIHRLWAEAANSVQWHPKGRG